jgi:hypothetical protein
MHRRFPQRPRASQQRVARPLLCHGYRVLAARRIGVELRRYSVGSEITMKTVHKWIIALVGFATVAALVRRRTKRRSESHVELKPEITMKTGHKWIIVLVAYDDPAIETRVIKERLAMDDDEQLAALLRGGELVEVVGFDNETAAEATRIEVERSCLR